MKNTIEVPKSALAIPIMAGTEDGEVSPEKGDPVSFHVEGTIRTVEDGYCVVQVKFINGKRPGPEFISEEDEEDDLRSMAENADMNEY